MRRNLQTDVSLGRMLKAYRLSTGRSQDEEARLFGITRRTYKNVESGYGCSARTRSKILAVIVPIALELTR